MLATKANTKSTYFKTQQGRNWTGTWFGKNLDEGIEKLKLNCLYFIAQVERCPTTNREHLQFLAHFDNNQRASKILSLLPGAHVEIARNTNACVEYCSKDESRIRGPFTNGIPPSTKMLQGKKLTV